MKALIYVLFPILLFIIGCGNDETNSQVTDGQVNNSSPGLHSGEVIEKIDAGSYTYLKVDENDQSYWIAVSKMPIEKGETVYFSQFMEMKHFRSETLDRTFSSVLFVSDASKTLNKMDLKTLHPQTKTKEVTIVSVEKVEDGKTIGEIYSEKNSLKGQTVKVRGKVVKFNGGIMDRNWIHLQDGTADGENNDLLVTSNESASVGDIVIAEGQLVLDKDFGAGYSYSILLENAILKKE